MVGHMVDQAPDVAPHPIRDSDVRLLIGMLAVLEGFALAGELPPRIADKLIDRFIRLSLLEPGATPKDLRQALNDLNHRLRYVLGEYPHPLDPVPVPDWVPPHSPTG